jgi:integrase
LSIRFCVVEDKFISLRSERDCLHAELPLLSPPFHPHSGVSVCSLGASWVFSMRRSELIGLKWLDVNFEELELSVTRSVYRQRVGRCKTEI